MKTKWKNIVHRINPKLLVAQIEQTCAKHEDWKVWYKAELEASLKRYEENPQHFMEKPNPSRVDPMVDEWVKRERKYYGSVRVIHVKTGYILVYGNAKNSQVQSGTGPFKTRKKAMKYFLNGGR